MFPRVRLATKLLFQQLEIATLPSHMGLVDLDPFGRL
jgi:hypothetical protein